MEQSDEVVGRAPAGRVAAGLRTLPTSAVKLVTAELGRAVVSGRYPPGSTLPVEAELAGRFGIGRSVLREAVKVLAGKGLLRTARRYGTRVCPHEDWNLLDPDVLDWLSTDDRLLRQFMFDLTEIRRALEPKAAELAAQVAKPLEIEALLAAAEALVQAAKDGHASAIEADVAFHARLFAASRNLVLIQVGRAVVAVLGRYFCYSVEVFGEYDPNPDQHGRIARAVAAHDPALARTETLALLEANREQARKLLPQGGCEDQRFRDR